jgi:hypothetical protein
MPAVGLALHVKATLWPLVAAPVPERVTDWGLPVALSETLKTAARAPRAEGVKSTTIVQVPPAATEVPQVLFWVKSLGLVPKTAMLLTVKVELPELVSVTV